MNLFHNLLVETLHASSLQANLQKMPHPPILTIRNLSAVFPDSNGGLRALETEALHAYASSDARLARVLTERRWPTAARFVDRHPAVA